MERIKKRWGIESNIQILIIFWVFAITGSTSVWVAKPFLHWLGLDELRVSDATWSHWLYWILRIVLIFPFYQILLVVYGWLFGQFKFFWNFERKMLKRLGLGFLFS